MTDGVLILLDWAKVLFDVLLDGAKVLFDGAEANENDVGRKNGEVVPFDLIAICCCVGCDVVVVAG